MLRHYYLLFLVAINRAGPTSPRRKPPIGTRPPSLGPATLQRLRETYGEPPRKEVAAFLTQTYNCDFELARAFATALWLFWQEEFEACVHLATPKIEGALRSLLLLLDEPLYRVEEGKKPGQFPGLGVLVAALEKHDFDEDWSRVIHVLLLPEGDNERNLIAHGLASVSTQESAAVILRLCGMAITLAPAGASDEDRRRASARLSDVTSPPPGWMRTSMRRRITRLARRLRRAARGLPRFGRRETFTESSAPTVG